MISLELYLFGPIWAKTFRSMSKTAKFNSDKPSPDLNKLA